MTTLELIKAINEIEGLDAQYSRIEEYLELDIPVENGEWMIQRSKHLGRIIANFCIACERIKELEEELKAIKEKAI